ncbi:barstar family protein (plasmid) [Streptomyces sp. SDT5-1]|uniref:barstar family protein n=1 Tax=Streptomyces sp. SDT5-1 TaxID=3406418 RepID=UPI003FCEFCC0
MCAVQEDEPARGRASYALTDPVNGHVWGVCAAVEGLFGQPRRGTYELFGWEPVGPGGIGWAGWVGSRVWLVAEEAAFDAWLLEDAESIGRPSPAGAGSWVLTGLDDYEGPPEGYRGRVRVHDGRHWLGSCREFTRILPPAHQPAPLVLRALAPSERLTAVLAKGTRRARNLEEAALEIRDVRGEPVTEQRWPTTIRTWRPSSRRNGLIDLELDGGCFTPIPEHARTVWEQWFAGPPAAVNAWAGLDTRRRGTWHTLARERAGRQPRHDRPDGHAYVLDGRYITDEPGLHLALGEAVNGPGGYFGGCLAALDDCLRGTFGHTAPATLHWHDAATARTHLSDALTPDGRPHDLFTAVVETLTEGGLDITLA